MNNIKKYIIWFILWISLISWLAYAADTWTIWALFEKVWWNWLLKWENIKEWTISKQKLENSVQNEITTNTNNISTNATNITNNTTDISNISILTNVSELNNDIWYITLSDIDPINIQTRVSWDCPNEEYMYWIEENWTPKCRKNVMFYTRQTNIWAATVNITTGENSVEEYWSINIKNWCLNVEINCTDTSKEYCVINNLNVWHDAIYVNSSWFGDITNYHKQFNNNTNKWTIYIYKWNIIEGNSSKTLPAGSYSYLLPAQTATENSIINNKCVISWNQTNNKIEYYWEKNFIEGQYNTDTTEYYKKWKNWNVGNANIQWDDEF